jgi:type IV secretory pathway VirB3-like protein
LVNHLLSIELEGSMEVVRSTSNVSLVIWSRREVTGPVSIGVVGIWEHVVILGRPGHVMLLEGIGVGTRSRVLEMIFVRVVFIHVRDHVVHVLVVVLSIRVFEIKAPKDEDFVGLVVLNSLDEVLMKTFSFAYGVEVLGVLIVDPWDIVGLNIPVVAIGWTIQRSVKNVSKNLSVVTKRLRIWSPDELHFIVAHSFFDVCVVGSSEEPGVIAHVRKESGIGIRVAEWINLPPSSGSYSELIQDPLVTHDMVVDHILISWTSLIMHRPAGIHKFKLTTLDQAFDFRLLFVGLEIPPHAEEFHLNF